MDVKELLDKGLVGLAKASAVKESRGQANGPILRGGSSGAVIGGKIYGNCARLAHLRIKGFQVQEAPKKQLMFSVGRALEEVLFELLTHSGLKPEQIKREEEDPISYSHSSSLPVEGRPDFILYSEAGERETGIECKGKLSYWGARNLLVEHKADTSHLVQAAHYMWAHDLKKYALVYLLPTKYPLSPKRKKDGEFLGWDGFENLPPEMVEVKGDWPMATEINYYVITLSTGPDSTLHVKMHNGKTYTTSLTWEATQAFYSEVVGMGKDAPLPPPPTADSILGKGMKEWKKCDYCALRPICDSETSYERWFEKCVDAVTESWAAHFPDLLDGYLNDWEEE